MRLALKNTLTFVIIYVLIIGGVAWWMAVQLRSLADTMAESTAELVGSEVARVLTEPALADLQRGDEVSRTRLEQIVDDVTQHSSILTSVAVVDRVGKVIAGDNVELDRYLANADLVFGDDYRVRLMNENRPFGGGSFYMLVPLKAGTELAGYLRLEMRSQRIAHLYSRALRNLALVALAGLVVVGLAGVGLHFQLARRGEALTRALAGAMRGEEWVPRERDEFAPALAVARQVGRQLSEARGELQHGQQRMVSLLKALDVGALVLEADLGLAFSNPNAAELLGCADPADLARRWDAEFRSLIAAVPRRIDGDAGRRTEFELPRNGSAARLRLEFYELGAETCEGFLVIVKSAESLEALQHELGLAIQMRGLTRFYAAFVHDLKAPLNAMVMTLELLKLNVQEARDGEEAGGGSGGQEKQLRYIGVLNEEIRRLDRQLRSLLSHTATSKPQRQELDLRVLLHELEALLAPQAKHQHVTLNTRVPDDAVTLVANADRLKQAMLNVLINALEAMPSGGTLAIELERRNGSACVVVRDDGPGIPPELLASIYDMHFTTKSGGTGVGLYVARSVVQAHGGTIEVHSAPGQGTTFTVSLPL
jgi:signal transduction histidine kinase